MTIVKENLNQSSNQNQEETFEWTKQWYPVAVVEFLVPSRPHRAHLLGKELVLWRDGSGKWSCFADFCPHRLAPLSEGRVESDGTLLCAYHAWRFDAQGNCVSIPQSQDKQTEAKHCSNPQSSAVVYPTQERQGLLWVWAEAGDQAEGESQLREPRLIPELESDGDKVVKLFWNIRDLPYGWDFFMENVADPAHVPVSHHGIMGSRYKDAKYYDMPSLRKISTSEGFSFAVNPIASETVTEAVHDFQPPCHMRIVSTYEDGGKLILALYATPTRPGWCRHIGCQVLVKSEAGKTPKGLGFFALPMPTWLGHVLASLFLHQDAVFLHYQEKNLARRQQDWLDAVYTPNPQDKMVITFRQWFKFRAGGKIPWDSGCSAQLPSVDLDKRQLFDVWATHTKDCLVCQNALRKINRLKVLSYVSAFVCLLLLIFIDAEANVMLPKGFPLAITGAIILATIAYLLNKLSRLFYVYEFEHSHND